MTLNALERRLNSIRPLLPDFSPSQIGSVLCFDQLLFTLEAILF